MVATRYVLEKTITAFRDGTRPPASGEDGRDVLVLGADFLAAWDALRVPTVVLRAPLGMFGQAPGLIADEIVAEAERRRPDFVVEIVAEANHYTIVLAERFAARVAHHIEA